jgi:hypothetical protein
VWDLVLLALVVATVEERFGELALLQIQHPGIARLVGGVNLKDVGSAIRATVSTAKGHL